ncbi:MAG: hypothetical protein CVV64_15395 [Candidatus Wallbacteria bacterium HGW-Wallbacteria-1]|jgi:hypothetical protein|uniref:Zinc-ribbon domain-containing protein n=1 Tax=Candidatus Wallbacteria bacterium HGW-Wallbacteria-1 TaxID=2013854 RepID=A0A2N1PLN6_9BACT|nr:MAG: hypothetical protein CVV64_15395 [Candidatus Wallbacteria bacterium HGW-Wallbacteria-1]
MAEKDLKMSHYKEKSLNSNLIFNVRQVEFIALAILVLMVGIFSELTPLHGSELNPSLSVRSPESPLRSGEKSRLVAEVVRPSSVSTGKILQPPTLEADWLQVMGVGVVSSGAFRNGTQVMIQQYLFDVMPLRSGQRVLPPLRVSLQGSSGEIWLDSPSMTMSVLPPLEKKLSTYEWLRRNSVVVAVVFFIFTVMAIVIIIRRRRASKLVEAQEAPAEPQSREKALEILDGISQKVRRGNGRESMNDLVQALDLTLENVIGGAISISDPSGTIAKVAEAGISHDVRRKLGNVLDACHQARYAGLIPRDEEILSLASETRRIVETISAKERGPVYVCPTCGNDTSPDDRSCSRCGEVFE